MCVFRWMGEWVLLIVRKGVMRMVQEITMPLNCSDLSDTERDDDDVYCVFGCVLWIGGYTLHCVLCLCVFWMLCVYESVRGSWSVGGLSCE